MTLDIEELERLLDDVRQEPDYAYGVFVTALYRDAEALIAAARRDAERRTRGELVEALNEQAEAQRSTIANLREALKAAEEFVAEQAKTYEPQYEGEEEDAIPCGGERVRSCLAAIHSALSSTP